MQKQKVFFFAAGGEGSGSMIRDEELREIAGHYVKLYGEACLKDPETPSFVKRLMQNRPQSELQRAG